jgi:mono/diheme cytochrome c family protein
MLRSHRVIAWILPRLLLAALIYTFLTPNADAASAGKQDFDANCASCHGFDGKGHGQAVYVVPQVKPADLTVLSKTNGSVFPTDGFTSQSMAVTESHPMNVSTCLSGEPPSSAKAGIYSD